MKPTECNEELLCTVEKVVYLFSLSKSKATGIYFLYSLITCHDFVGVSDSKENLQKLIDVISSYCSKWRLRANVSKSAVMLFSKDVVNGCWK